MELRTLTSDEYSTLYDALADCLAVDSGESDRIGTHLFLMHTLGEMGYKVYSWGEAEETAKRLLDG